MHILRGQKVNLAALAHEMIRLLRRVRTLTVR